MNTHNLARALRLLLDSFGGTSAQQVESVPAVSSDAPGTLRFSALGRGALSAACSTFGAQTGLRWSVQYLGGMDTPQTAVVCVEADQAPPDAVSRAEAAGAPAAGAVPVVPVMSVEVSGVSGRRFVVRSEQEGRPEIGAAEDLLIAMAAALDLDDLGADLLAQTPTAGGFH